MSSRTTIVNQCLEIQQDIHYITSDGNIIKRSIVPTHILITHAQYISILKDVGLDLNPPVVLEDIYGLSIVFTTVPIIEPKVLSLSFSETEFNESSEFKN